MHARQRLRQVAVAFVGHDHAAAGFGDQEVGAGDAHVGGQEPLPQLGARFRQDVAPLREHPVRRQVGVGQAELRLPILPVQVEGRGDDVARRFLAELDDVLAQVRLDRRDAV